MTSKYRAEPCTIDGIRFASKLEGRRYQQLKLMERAGNIEDLRLQKRFPLLVKSVKIGEYIADFEYWDCINRKWIIEDAKGVLTPLCRWKLKHMVAQGDAVTLWPPRKTRAKKAKP